MMVQKYIVEDAEKASGLLPMHVALVKPDGTPVNLDGGGAPNATTTTAGLVKKSSGVASVASADATECAGSAPTKAEFDAVVKLANETKKQLNDALAKLKSAGITA